VPEILRTASGKPDRQATAKACLFAGETGSDENP
jgi:hypothetical protein